MYLTRQIICEYFLDISKTLFILGVIMGNSGHSELLIG